MIPDQLRERMKGIRLNVRPEDGGISMCSLGYGLMSGNYNGIEWSVWSYIPVTGLFTHYEIKQQGAEIIHIKCKNSPNPTREEMETLIEQHITHC